MKRVTPMLPAIIVVAAAATLFASRPQRTFKGGIEAVRLDVSVTRGGLPVSGLSAADFAVTDNDVLQQIEVLADPLPVAVVLVLDTSGSVAGERLSHLVKAATTLVGALHAGDRAALMTFSHDVNLRLPLTADVNRLTNALNSLAGRGQTAVRDAVYAALQLAPEDESRPVVLLFSDGRDNASWLSVQHTLTAARRAGVVIHAVSLREQQPAELVQPGRPAPVQPEAAPTFVDELVNAAGGRHWQTTASADLQPLFIRALDEMRARYLLMFYPQGVRREGWHDLKVTLKRARGTITVRPGYFVPNPG